MCMRMLAKGVTNYYTFIPAPTCLDSGTVKMNEHESAISIHFHPCPACCVCSCLLPVRLLSSAGWTLASLLVCSDALDATRSVLSWSPKCAKARIYILKIRHVAAYGLGGWSFIQLNRITIFCYITLTLFKIKYFQSPELESSIMFTAWCPVAVPGDATTLVQLDTAAEEWPGLQEIMILKSSEACEVKRFVLGDVSVIQLYEY